MYQIKYGLFILLSISLSSCLVTKKKFLEQQTLADKYKAERDNCNEKLALSTAETDSLKSSISNLEKYISSLQADSALQAKNNKELDRLNKELSTLYKDLDADRKELSELTEKQKQQYLASLATKEKQLKNKEKEIEDKQRKVAELEANIAQQDSVLKGLRNKIMSALTGYSDSLLTVKIKDGKIYVSVSDKLLFKSGSTQVDEQGVAVLQKLSKSLEKQNDFNIVIEGHTDSIPYKSTAGCIKDNWDLSVLRATSVMNILLENKNMSPLKIIPSGRADLMPISDNSTPENRSKNRRTEIILSPDTKSLLDIVNK